MHKKRQVNKSTVVFVDGGNARVMKELFDRSKIAERTDDYCMHCIWTLHFIFHF